MGQVEPTRRRPRPACDLNQARRSRDVDQNRTRDCRNLPFGRVHDSVVHAVERSRRDKLVVGQLHLDG